MGKFTKAPVPFVNLFSGGMLCYHASLHEHVPMRDHIFLAWKVGMSRFLLL